MQHLIVLVMAILAAALTYVVIKWPGGLHMTFSQHVALRRESQLFYALLFMAVLPLLLWFFAVWLVPERGLPDAFLWCAVAAAFFQVACTFVPETGGGRTMIHRTLAGISGLAMLPLVGMLVVTPSVSTFARATAAVAFVAMSAIMGFAIKYRAGHNRVLLLQVGYYLAFFVAILAATYL